MTLTIARPGLIAIAFCLCAFAQKDAPKSWLDVLEAKGGKTWNRAGKRIPKPPHSPELDEFCRAEKYTARTLEEKAVAALGWALLGAADMHNEISVVGASASRDGMCRPNEFQYFVFANTKFVGTLSPGVMFARDDGAISGIAIPGDGRIVVEYLRYSQNDPLCCPSRITTADFAVRSEKGPPVLAITAMRTGPAR